MTEYRGPQDLTLLLEQHQKEIWDWKQKESQWIRDKNQLDGNKQIIEELSTKLIESAKINLAHKELNGKLQTRLTEVEEDNKKLAIQIQDLTTPRKFGDGTH
jgi:hypothetical protein